MHYVDPSFIHPDSRMSGTTTKKIHQMSTSEIKEKANRDAVTYYKQELERDPHNPTLKQQYINACSVVGVQPDAELDRLYQMPLEKLKAEWVPRGRTVEDQNLDAYRVEQGKIWMASQPRYIPSMPAANLIYERMNALGLKGTVHEHQLVWEQLVGEGKIDAPPAPVALYSREEIENMGSAAEMKEALQRMGF